MKILSKVLCALLAVFCGGVPAAAYGSTEKIMWYYRPTKDHSRPTVLDGSGMPDEYGALYLGAEDEKKIYLTFDAGYGNENVESILNTLKKHNATAAFFILPGIIKNSPELVMRMAEEGHTVCNHTSSHGDMSRITDIERFKAELTGLEELYRERTGHEMTKYFRPPEGSFSIKTLEFCKELGYTPVFWTFAYPDWDMKRQPDPAASVLKVLSGVHDGMVMLMHPMSRTNALILDEVLTTLENDGYTFGTLDELAECNRR